MYEFLSKDLNILEMRLSNKHDTLIIRKVLTVHMEHTCSIFLSYFRDFKGKSMEKID